MGDRGDNLEKLVYAPAFPLLFCGSYRWGFNNEHNKRGYGPVSDALTPWFVWCRGPESNWGHEDFQSKNMKNCRKDNLLKLL